MQFPSSYWSTHFSDLHGTLLKNSIRPVAAFQKSFVQIRGKTKRMTGIKTQKITVHTLAVFKRVLQIKKLLVASS
jgi:hypothetical protein